MCVKYFTDGWDCLPARKVMRFPQTLGMAVAALGMLSHRSGLCDIRNIKRFNILRHPIIPELVRIVSPYFLVAMNRSNGNAYDCPFPNPASVSKLAGKGANCISPYGSVL
jgi:hypothetical protein